MKTPPKINSSTQKAAKILLAPLDWGLGHATRCIPIIKELLRLKCEVIIAATGSQKALLHEEFPYLTIVDLPGYGVKYGKNRAFSPWKIFTAIPKILIGIKRERAWLRRFVRREKPDFVLSDNRYGLYHPGVLSVFITHQLGIRTPFGLRIDRWVQSLQYRMLRRFSMCWVPDRAAGHTINPAPDSDFGDSLAGDLSHPRCLPPIPLRYIGVLSRFERPAESPQDPAHDRETRGNPEQGADNSRDRAHNLGPGAGNAGSVGGDLLVLLSGPEPQRTIFEKMLLVQLAGYPGPAVLVRGLPGDPKTPNAPPGPTVSSGLTVSPGLTVHPHLGSEALQELISRAGWVLCRPGYSSVMDLFTLGKKCIFVPTPGQTEQEYLGHYLAGKGWALCIRQQDLSLAEAIAAADRFVFLGPVTGGRGLAPNEELRPVLSELLQSVRRGETP